MTDAVSITWGLFVLLEKAGGSTRPEVDAFYEGAEAEQAAWEGRMCVNLVLDPVPVRSTRG